MQLIYDGMTDRRIPNITFPNGFSLSTNQKHYSNTVESIKIIEEIISPRKISTRKIEITTRYSSSPENGCFSWSNDPSRDGFVGKRAHLVDLRTKQHDTYISALRFHRELMS